MAKFLDGLQKLLLHGQPVPEAFASLVGPGWDGSILVTEGRPLLSGAQCTAPALLSRGYRPKLISDNMAAHCMWKGMVQAAVICYWSIENTGLMCPVGSLGITLCAAFHQIPIFALPAQEPEAVAITANDLLFFLGHRVAAEHVEAFVPTTDLVAWQWIAEARTTTGESLLLG